MEELMFGIDDDFEKGILKFSAFELALLLLSAILHDIGMFIRPEDKVDIQDGRIKYSNSLTYSGVFNVVKDSDEAIKEIVRITHAQRINEFIDYDFNGKTISKILMLDDKYPYADDVAAICVSHGENYDYLKSFRTNYTKGNYTYNLRYLSAMLRIADYLDLDKQRTPVLWYKMMQIEGFSKEEWEKHFIIHNEKKIKKYINNKVQIFFEGKSSSAKIHRKYLKYIDDLKEELENADMLLNTKETDEKYIFNLSVKIDDKVETEGFEYSDLRLNLDYSAITELLMGKNIYGTNQLGLRELIQNSIDACEIMKEIQNNGFDSFVEPQIFITFSKSKNYVKIKDTGIGMTLDVVKKHFLNIGKSYYKSNEYLYENYNYKPIGQYGIGFLACFLLSNNVIVRTKYYKNNEVVQIELEKNSEYVVTNTEVIGSFFGTEIILDYDKFFDVFGDEKEITNFLKKYFYTSIPIKLRDDDSATEYNIIKNDCTDIVEMKIDKDSQKSKVVQINCDEFSEDIEGNLYFQPVMKNKKFEVVSLQGQENDIKYYYFDTEENKFKQLKDKKLENGYYNFIKYAYIDEKLYNQIIASKKLNKNKRQEIFALSQRVVLLISGDVLIGYDNCEDNNYCITFNNIGIRKALLESDIPYYEELLDEFEYIEKIFVFNNQYVNLQSCYFEGGWFGVDELDNSSFYLYNKGVLIRKLRGIKCYLPFAMKLMGVLNYKDHGIKLDVSRNYIIDGNSMLEKKIANIIMKFKLNEVDEKFKCVISEMIKFNESNSLYIREF